jgi:hypothetical protein
MSKIKLGFSLFWSVIAIFICYTTYELAEETKKILETIKIFFVILGGYGVLISIIHQSETIIMNNKQIEDKIQFDKIENSFNLLKDWDNPSLLEARKYTRKIKELRPSISDNTLLDEIKKNEDLNHSLIMTFNFWEQVYLSIKNDRVESNILKTSFKDTYIDMYDRFKVHLDLNDNSTTQSLQDFRTLWSS